VSSWRGTQQPKRYYHCLTVLSTWVIFFLFGLNFNYKNNQIKNKIYKKNWNRTEPNLIPTDQFRFGSVFYVKNKKKLYCFLTFKSHKIRHIFIISNPHDSVESIPDFSQANSLLQNHKNISHSLTIINCSSLSQT
jgi:hypothetical protein